MRKVWVSLSVGFVVGILSTVAFLKYGVYQPAIYELTKEIDLQKVYPFHDMPAVLGTLKPGTKYQIIFKKGIVDYVELHTAFNRTEMAEASIVKQKARGLLTLWR